MKKFALLTALILSLCSVTACGDSDDSGKKSDKSSVTGETTTTSSDDTEAETDDSTTDPAKENESDKEEDTDNSDEQSDNSSESEESDTENPDAANDESTVGSSDEDEFVRGVVNGNVYTSEYNGIKLTMPDGWYFSTDDAILNMMGIGLDVIGDSTLVTQEMLEQLTIYDALVQNPLTGENIIIMYENIAKEVLNPEQITAEDYMEILQNQLKNVSAVKYSDFSDVEQVTLAGETYYTCHNKTEYEMLGVSCMQYYYVRKIGDLMLTICATSGQDCGDMTVYESCFEAL